MRQVLQQPQRVPSQIIDGKVKHLLRDEYHIKQITKAEANTIEQLPRRLRLGHFRSFRQDSRQQRPLRLQNRRRGPPAALGSTCSL